MNIELLIFELLTVIVLSKAIWASYTLLKLGNYVKKYCSFNASMIKPLSLRESLDLSALSNPNTVAKIMKELGPQIEKNLQKMDFNIVLARTLKIPSLFLTFIIALISKSADDFINMEEIDKMWKEMENLQ